jgi:hypothetical protein
MEEQKTNWIEQLKKGDKVYCVSEQYGSTDFFKVYFIKSVNKDTVSIEDENGKAGGCFYKNTGDLRADSKWNSRHTYILNPAEEAVQQKLIRYNIRAKFYKLMNQITKLDGSKIKVQRKKELIPVMEAFLTEWEKQEEVKP